MPEMRYPGVYVEEIPALRPIEGVSTTTAAFLGFAPAGKVGVPVEVDSWQGFCREFAPGRTEPYSLPMYMPHAVRGYFENGGRKAIVLRLDEACTGPAQYVQEIAKLDSVPDVSMVVTPETQDEQVVEAVLAQVADLKRGVYKAPAGTEAAVLGVTGTSRTISASERDRLREAHALGHRAGKSAASSRCRADEAGGIPHDADRDTDPDVGMQSAGIAISEISGT